MNTVSEYFDTVDQYQQSWKSLYLNTSQYSCTVSAVLWTQYSQ
jgi:hypothetical protein